MRGAARRGRGDTRDARRGSTPRSYGRPTLLLPAPTPTPTKRPAVPGPAAPHDTTVVVRPGDNLWVIARRALGNGTRAIAPAVIAPYWRRVIAANAATLRSHDPNLIFPGERVVLPVPH